MVTVEELVDPLRSAVHQDIPLDVPLLLLGHDSALVIEWLLAIEDIFCLRQVIPVTTATAREIHRSVVAEQANRQAEGSASNLPTADPSSIDLPGAVLRRQAEAVAGEEDLEAMTGRFPWVADEVGRRKDRDSPLAIEYRAYVTGVSPVYMAISAQLAAFVQAYCRHEQPRTILDLGSGFSSVIFGLYKKESPGVEVWTVDDSPTWLERTRAHLLERGIPGGHFALWGSDDLPDSVDLVLHDMGFMEFREAVLPKVFASGDVVILDDVNKPYGTRARHANAAAGRDWLSLRALTVDRGGRFASLSVR